MAGLAFDDVSYPYYAPLGAVVAMGFSVAASVRDSLRAIGAILLGLAIAMACDYYYTLGSSAAGVALVIGVGVLVAGWRRLGGQGTWVPTSALFVLILANDSNVVEYVGSYGGLTLLGMLIGVALNATFPAHPLARFDAFAANVRHRLANQLDGLADGLADDDAPLSAEGWEGRRDDMLPVIAEVRAITQETAESGRGNLRARWHRSNADLQYAYAQLLERIAFQTETLTQLIAGGERSENRSPALGDLRGSATAALRTLAAVLRLSQSAASTEARKAVAEAHRELRAFEEDIHRIRHEARASILDGIGDRRRGPYSAAYECHAPAPRMTESALGTDSGTTDCDKGGAMTAVNETGSVTGTKDKHYNILWYTEACLSNALRLDGYIQDAERDGDSELAEFFRKAQSDSQKGAEQGKALLKRRLNV